MSVSHPHVAMVAARTDGLNGVRLTDDHRSQPHSARKVEQVHVGLST